MKLLPVPHSMIGLLLLAAVLLACSPQASPASPAPAPAGAPRLKVVATTSVVADTVRAIGGDQIELRVLLPPDSDPHTFQPTPQDIAAVADADLVFASGLGLETFLEALLRSAGSRTPVVSLSEGIGPIELSAAGEEHAPEPDHEDHETEGVDPHVWLDPINMITWADQVAEQLQRLDPENQARYRQNAAAYQRELRDLDEWIAETVSQLPAERRLLVTDHNEWGYFARRYGFRVIGALIPGFSTLSEPSAKELAGLEQQIRALGASAILVGSTVSPGLAERVARDTGIRLVRVYTASLSEPSGPAPTYQQMMRYNVEMIVEALR